MAGLRLSGVEKRFGAQPVLEAIDLDIADGELIVVVGPSGCGKSTLLRIVAGLEDPSAGTLQIGGRDMAEVPPAERGVAMVFQSYALYPHMSVFENMAFALKTAKRPKDEIDATVRAAAKTLDLESLLERKPKALSGGQRQRVAIGRAIVRQPEVFLFDEPLSNLDAALRVRMRHELARLHADLQTTMVYVTHDQVEAMTLADRIVVLNQGRIEQVGTPQELYRRPANLFVAGFIGSPRMNLLPVQLMETGDAAASVWLGARAIAVRGGAGDVKPGEPLTLGVRPEGLRPTRADDGLELTVRFVEPLGGVAYAHGALEGATEPVIVQLPGDTAAAAGDVIRLKIDAAAARLFDSSGRAVE